jgi:hypothetical protein
VATPAGHPRGFTSISRPQKHLAPLGRVWVLIAKVSQCGISRIPIEFWVSVRSSPLDWGRVFEDEVSTYF